MNVLHVIPSVSEKHGGPTYAIRAIATALKRAGMKVVIATTDDDGDNARLEVPLGTPIERDGVTHVFFRRALVPYKVSFGLARWLNSHIHQFDVVHIHALFSFASSAASFIAQRKRIPYVIRPLGVLNRWGMKNRRRWQKRLSLRLIELPILRRAAAIHFTTEAERREAADIGADVAARSFVIPIPVEVETDGPNAGEFVRSFPSAAGKKLILFLSRVHQKKGLELLLKAFVGVKRSEPDSLLVIAGNGNSHYIEALRAQAAELGISADMLWTGFLGPTEKAAAFAAASVFVLPSYSENFGIAAAEALAAGVPCILSDQVALGQDAVAHHAVIVVRPEEGAIRTAVLHVLNDQSLREQLSAGARALAVQTFSLETVGKSLAERYDLIKLSDKISI